MRCHVHWWDGWKKEEVLSEEEEDARFVSFSNLDATITQINGSSNHELVKSNVEEIKKYDGEEGYEEAKGNYEDVEVSEDKLQEDETYDAENNEIVRIKEENLLLMDQLIFMEQEMEHFL